MIKVSYLSEQKRHRAENAISEFMECDPEALFLALLNRGFTPHLAARIWVEAKRIQECDRQAREFCG